MGASSVEVLRAEDHVVLTIDGVNLVIEPGPDGPQMVRADPAQDAFLIVGLPPQSIVEQAYQEGGPAGPAGTTERRASGPSRVAFRVPDGLKTIPFTITSLLDWTGLEPHLPPQARALPGAVPDPAPGSVSEPAREETAIELPYRIVLSQGPDETWLSAHVPATLEGATTLWHARLAHLGAVLGRRRRGGEPGVAGHSPRGVVAGLRRPSRARRAAGEPGFRTELKAAYRSEIVSLSSDYQNLTLPAGGGRFRRRAPSVCADPGDHRHLAALLARSLASPPVHLGGQ